MWSALLGEKRDSYQFDNDTNLRLIVPASDIDVACARLFGPEVQPNQHQEKKERPHRSGVFVFPGLHPLAQIGTAPGLVSASDCARFGH